MGRRALLWAGALLAVGAAVLSFASATAHRVAEPFDVGWLGRNGARYAVAARNLLREPLAVTRAWPTFESGDVPDSRFVPYVRHPPLFPWLVAGSFALFGPSENAARAIPLVATVLLAAALGFVAARRGNVLAGAAAVSTFLLLPMTQLYGTHVDMQSTPLVLFMVLSTWAAAQRVERRGLHLSWFVLTLAIALAIDWPAWILAALLVPLLLRRGDRRAATAAAVLLMAGSVAMLASVVASSDLHELTSAITQRSTSFWSGSPGRSDVAGWLARFDQLLPIWLWASAGVLLVVALMLRRRARRGEGVAPVASTEAPAKPFPVALVLLATGVLYVLAFPTGAYVHDYWAHVLAAPLALLVGAAVERVQEAQPKLAFALAPLLAVAAGFSGREVPRRVESSLEKEREARHRLLGEALHAAVPFDAHVLTNADYNVPGQWLLHPSFSWYGDRDVIGGVLTPAQLESARATFEPTHYLLLPFRELPIDPALLAWLEQHGTERPFPLRKAKLWELRVP